MKTVCYYMIVKKQFPIFLFVMKKCCKCIFVIRPPYKPSKGSFEVFVRLSFTQPNEILLSSKKFFFSCNVFMGVFRIIYFLLEICIFVFIICIHNTVFSVNRNNSNSEYNQYYFSNCHSLNYNT